MFDHSLHGSVVESFEKEFAKYVGAKYACSVSSATNAIFLSFLNKNQLVEVPSMIPPVVLNALINSGNQIDFVDNIGWVGNSYVLHDFGDYKVIDSAQRVDKMQYSNEANPSDLMIFSFYPTKPIGSLDGGMIVSDDFAKIKWFKEATLNGMSYDRDNWSRSIKFPGWKMYMSSFQAYIALQNFYKIEEKKARLADIRQKYNALLGYENTSEHLYRINVPNREGFMNNMKQSGINCGIHYLAAHKNFVYSGAAKKQLLKTEVEERTTVSIPYHEKLTDAEIDIVVEYIKKYMRRE